VPTGRVYNLRHKIFTGPTVQALPDLIDRPLSSTTEVQRLHSVASALRLRLQPVDATRQAAALRSEPAVQTKIFDSSD
jgi:hypothetical protein